MEIVKQIKTTNLAEIYIIKEHGSFFISTSRTNYGSYVVRAEDLIEISEALRDFAINMSEGRT